MNKNTRTIKAAKPQQGGRGATVNPANRFHTQSYTRLDESEMWHTELSDEQNEKTQYIDIFPKKILSHNDSPDIGFNLSINPYNGCEHGCTYCYARNSHEYWGYSAGRDFESKILVKKDAARLLDEALSAKNYKPEFVMMSGNTDCYQPAERRFEITRQCLEVFLKHRHPVGIITKNALLLRDLDLLRELHDCNLLRLTLSITTLDETVRRAMEPRTSTIAQRLKALEVLVSHGIAVNVNMAPIIMGINSEEILPLVKTVGALGAYSVQYIMVRLNGQIAHIFENWVKQALPERAEKILNQIRDTHGGALNDSRWSTRMRGEGHYAGYIKQVFETARRKYIHAQAPPPLDFSSFVRNRSSQLALF